MFGVATKKDRQFYNTLEETAEGEGTQLKTFQCACAESFCGIEAYY